MDLIYIFQWWFIIFCLGLISLPLTTVIFKNFFDRGYAFTKVLGIAIISYFLFLSSTFKIVAFANSSILLVTTIFLLINAYVFVKNKKTILTTLREKIRILVFQEILFTGGLIFWAAVRSYQPDINGLEKFMDYGFINSLLRTKYLPPVDMWFAGQPINYYWFGHFITATLTKVSAIPSSITYNLMLATILGFSLTQTFSLVSTLASYLNPKKVRAAIGAGLVSAILLNFAGNFHTPIYALKNGIDKYWYPDATRFIGYHPENNDKTIHEFPLYSFVVSDLHPHLMNFPFVILYLAFLLRFLKTLVKSENSAKKSVKSAFPLSFLLGIFFMTSTWDFANYSLVTGIGILIFILRKHGVTIKSLFQIGLYSGLIAAVGLVFASPFILNFKSIAQGVDFVHSHTPLWQLGVLWGFPAVMTVIFALTFLKNKKLNVSDLFVICLFVSSWSLIFIPEIIFVKDIYIATHHRANTMFKLTYEAFVMFYLTTGYVVAKSVLPFKNYIGKIFVATFFAVLFMSVLWYANFAIKSYYADLKIYKGLEGENWLPRTHPDAANVIEWFRKNVTDQPVILEAPGDSYTEYNVISSYTGLPTVSGWFVHEWLWRGAPSFPQERVTEIDQIYTSPNLELTKSLLAKYNVSYVILGQFEKTKYPNINDLKFKTLGKTVFTSGNTEVVKVN